jgi:hypothetical protein
LSFHRGDDPFGSADVNDREAVGSANLAQHAMHMIADSLLRQLKSVGDLLITQPLRDKSHQLMLPIG